LHSGRMLSNDLSVVFEEENVAVCGVRSQSIENYIKFAEVNRLK